MIKKLRIKFIIIAMVAIAVVLYGIIGAVNIRNYVNVIEKADDTLALLVNGGGKFDFNDETPPSNMPNTSSQGLPDTSSESSPNTPTESSSDTPPASPPNTPPSGNGGKRPNGMTPETPFETRYFTVRLDKSGEAIAVNTDNIAAVSKYDAVNYAKDLFSAGKSNGFSGNYRYVVSKAADYADFIFVDCTRDLNTFHSFLQGSMLISLAGLALVFVLIFILSRIIVKPVAETYKKQKQFITDANHELKTPLTVIGANCDILEMEQGANEWTSSIRNQVEKLTELTNKLVFLSRMDEENAKVDMTDFSLSEVAADTVKPYFALALSSGKKLETEIGENITANGDISLIRELLTLLFDNAFKYFDDKGHIKFNLSHVGKNKIITLTNTVDGIPQGNLDKLFERFYRLDKSRNSETGGHGIGLSVAKAIAELHNGKISAWSEDGRTISFKVILP